MVQSQRQRNQKTGLIIAAFMLLYLAATVAFIIVY